MKKRIILWFLMSLLLFAMCLMSPTSARNTYDERIFQMAERSNESLSKDDYNHNIAIKELENGSYRITLDGVSYLTSKNYDQIVITNDSFIKEDISLVTDENLTCMFERAKSNVVKYVSFSNIIRDADKEQIENDIWNIPLYSGSFVLDESIKNILTDEEIKSIGEIVAIYEDGSVYINSSAASKVTEFILTHELFHYVSEVTNNGFENQDYSYSIITEVITDFLAVTSTPPSVEIVNTSYLSSYEDVLLYISVYKNSALKAYFYGYDEIWKKAGKDEFDFFVYCLDNNQNILCRDWAKLMVIEFKKDL